MSFSALTAFGVVALGAMMVFWWLEERGAGFTFAFGLACLAASLYGWLSGTWPFGVIEAIWAGVAFRRWHGRRHGLHAHTRKVR